MMSTRSQKSRIGKKPTSKVRDIEGNSSYVIIGDHRDETNTELDVLSDLRDRLARAEYDLGELRDEKIKLRRELDSAMDHIRFKESEIEKLHKTIQGMSEGWKSQNKLPCTSETQTVSVVTKDMSVQATQIKATADGATQTESLAATNGKETETCTNRSPVMDKIDVGQQKTESRVGPQGPRLLFLGDSQGRSMGSILRDILGKLYLVESIFKPNALFEDVVRDITNLTMGFTKTDYVVVQAGTNNVLRKRMISDEVLKNLVRSLTHTNLILVSVPYWRKDSRLIHNHLVYTSNLRMYNTVLSTGQSIYYIDIDSLIAEYDMFFRGLHIKDGTKANIAGYISHLINGLNNMSFSDTNIERGPVNLSNLIVIKPNKLDAGVLDCNGESGFQFTELTQCSI